MSSSIVALNRVSSFLSAEELPEPCPIDNNLTSAVHVDGDFVWEAPGKVEKSDSESGSSSATKTAPKSKEGKATKKRNIPRKSDNKAIDVLPTAREASESVVQEVKELDIKDEEQPFGLKGLKLEIAKGSFVAIVGRVGSGKVSDNCPQKSVAYIGLQSSLLQSLIGEMRKTRGEVKRQSLRLAALHLCQKIGRSKWDNCVCPPNPVDLQCNPARECYFRW